MKQKTITIFLLIAVCTSCAGFDPQAYVPGLYTATPTLTQVTPSPIPSTPTLPLPTEEPIVMRTVCTNIPNGQLHVRFEPGEGNSVRGYLLEGETVALANEKVDWEGTIWQKISHPIEGWVNTTYLCEKQP